MSDHPLQLEIAEITRALLDQVTTTPPDPLRPEEKVRTRAFLLMAHAVLEERIEEIFLGYFVGVRSAMATGSAVSPALIGVAAAALEWGANWLPKYTDRQWPSVIGSPIALRHVTAQVEKNHGLKDENLERLAKLVGIDWNLIDDDAGIELAALRTLGVKRGAAGHRSPFSEDNFALDGQDYPQNVREWVEHAAASVIRLEQVVQGLLPASAAR